jgi:hypothetical protein
MNHWVAVQYPIILQTKNQNTRIFEETNKRRNLMEIIITGQMHLFASTFRHNRHNTLL